MSAPLDLRGKRFGRLTAIAPMPERAKDGAVVWHCECDCGGFTKATVRHLTNGQTRSCGCLYRDTRYALYVRNLGKWARP